MEVTTIIILIISLVCLSASLIAISELIEATRMKGHCQDGAGLLWFVGIFASPLVLGLITASLPDRNAQTQNGTAPQPDSLRDELPAI